MVIVVNMLMLYSNSLI